MRLFLANVLGVIDGHGRQRFVLPVPVQQHSALQTIDTALPIQLTGQRLVVEHSAETGMQAEQRRHLRAASIEQQQRVEPLLLRRFIAAELSNGRAVHHVPQLELETQRGTTTDLAQDLENTQRITTELEEVVGDTELFDLQDFLPNLHQRLFQLVARRHVFAFDGLRVRQRLALDLAIGAQRQGIEHQDPAWHHIVRQHLLQRTAQALL
ncbi:hypothetical protein D9M71_524030 [compost metagenome]